MFVETEVARPSTWHQACADMRAPAHVVLVLVLALALLAAVVVVVVRAESALVARARVGVLGALSAARAGDATPVLGRCLESVLAEWFGWVMEDESGACTRAHD